MESTIVSARMTYHYVFYGAATYNLLIILHANFFLIVCTSSRTEVMNSSSRKNKRKPYDSNQPINYINRQQLKQNNNPSNTKSTGTNKIKKQIRDINRLLQHNTNLPAAAVNEKKLQLDKLQQQLNHVQQNKLQQKYKQKYKAIKFHDLVKTNRLYDQLIKQLRTMAIDTSSNSINNSNVDVMSDAEYKLRQQIKLVELDLQYIKHFPANEKYLSLYANTTDKSLIRDSNRIDENNTRIASIRQQIAKTLQMHSLNNESIESRLNIPRTLVSKTHIPNEDFINEKNNQHNNNTTSNTNNTKHTQDSLFISDSDDDNNNDTNAENNRSNNNGIYKNDITENENNNENDDSTAHKPKKSKNHKKHKKSSKHSDSD